MQEDLSPEELEEVLARNSRRSWDCPQFGKEDGSCRLRPVEKKVVRSGAKGRAKQSKTITKHGACDFGEPGMWGVYPISQCPRRAGRSD